MGALIKTTIDPANYVQALIYTLLGVFDATRDLYQTLTVKEKRDYELSLRSKGYPASRSIHYVEEERLGGDESMVMDKAAVKRQFEIGYEALGSTFAVGDALAHTSLQAQIITLQSLLVSTFLYGPASPDPISNQLAKLSTGSRAAGTSCVDYLAALQTRLQEALPPATPRSLVARSNPAQGPTYPVTNTGTSVTSVVPTQHHESSRVRSGSPVKTTILEWRGKLKSDTDGTSVNGSTSYETQLTSHDLYCPYAVELQRHATQPLSSSIASQTQPYCPHCQRSLHLSPGKAWEVFKDEDGYRRCFQVSNRFVVKCHREGPDGQYACVLCSVSAPVITVCGDVKALMKHIWEDHTARELKHEEDVVEILQQPMRSRRDSVTGYGTSRGTRRSASQESSRRYSDRRRKSLPALEREVELFDMRSSRRGA